MIRLVTERADSETDTQSRVGVEAVFISDTTQHTARRLLPTTPTAHT